MEIKFNLNKRLFLKDPQDSELGKKMIEHSIILFDKLGFEAFTFKKLAKAINSTEKSIYRYFENKHFMLLFLSSWYWEWVKYLIEINSRNIDDPERKLKIAIQNTYYATLIQRVSVSLKVQKYQYQQYRKTRNDRVLFHTLISS